VLSFSCRVVSIPANWVQDTLGSVLAAETVVQYSLSHTCQSAEARKMRLVNGKRWGGVSFRSLRTV
jgi:hypothetical protein